MERGYWASAVGALTECETALRRLVAEAAEAGNYEVVMGITQLASELGRLATAPRDSSIIEGSERPVADVGASSTASIRPLGRKATKRIVGSSGNHSSGTYPRFFRRGRELLKVGWSRTARSEYEHRVPMEALSLVVARLARVAAEEDLVRVDERLLKALEVREGELIPTYQVYVTLAWLRAEGLVRQHGRKGYSLTQPDVLERNVEARFEALQEIHP